MFDALVFLRINFFIRKQRSMKTLRLVKLPACLPPVHRSSFGSIEKCGYQYHWVHASEKPSKLIYKFYSLARSCTQTNSTPSPHTAPVAARNAPVWARSHHIGTVPVQPNTAPNSPPLGLSYPRTAFPVQALPRRVSPVQEKSAQINTKKANTNPILSAKHTNPDFAAGILP